jgi:peptidoglycan/LPS O-acetylase OafA/YrhL
MLTTTPRRLLFLDTGRFWAIMAVFLFHSLGATMGRDQVDWGEGFWRRWQVGGGQSLSFLLLSPAALGSLGVAAFFALSGFCIHLSFVRDPESSWGSFFKKRAWRILPAYLFWVSVLSVVYIFDSALLPWQFSLVQLSAHLVFVHNLNSDLIFGINPSLWSIAVEVQLYLLYPILIFLSRKYSWPVAIGIAASIELILRFPYGLLVPQFSWPFGIPSLGFTPIYVLSWSMGAWTGERYSKELGLPLAKIPIWLCVLAMVASWSFRPASSFTFLLASLSTCVWISKNIEEVRGESVPCFGARTDFVKQAMESIGVWSYSIYLVHQPVLHVFSDFLRRQTLFHSLLQFALCVLMGFPVAVAISYLSYTFIEHPFMRYGRR